MNTLSAPHAAAVPDEVQVFDDQPVQQAALPPEEIVLDNVNVVSDQAVTADTAPVEVEVVEPSARAVTEEEDVLEDPLFMQQGEPLVTGPLPGEAPPAKRNSPPPMHVDAAHAPHFLTRGDAQDGAAKSAEDEPRKVEATPVPMGVSDSEAAKEPADHIDVAPQDAAAMTTDEKRALFERADVDPFSLMGDDSLVAPGAVESGDVTPLEGDVVEDEVAPKSDVLVGEDEVDELQCVRSFRLFETLTFDPGKAVIESECVERAGYRRA